MKKCFQLDERDNVATLLEDAEAEPVTVCGQILPRYLRIVEGVRMGHKVSLIDIAAEAQIVKYGVVIGIACADIRAGEWVHLHNCRSQLDERSNHLDRYTGAPKDTVYE